MLARTYTFWFSDTFTFLAETTLTLYVSFRSQVETELFAERKKQESCKLCSYRQCGSPQRILAQGGEMTLIRQYLGALANAAIPCTRDHHM